MADRSLEAQTVAIVEDVAGVHQLVVVPAGYDLVMISLVLTAAGDILITFQDTASLMDLHMIKGVPVPLAENNCGWLRGTTGQNFSISLGVGVAVGGTMTYRLIPSHSGL